MKKYIKHIVLISLILISVIILMHQKKDANKKSINIGYQSVTAQIWSAIIIKNFKLIEECYQKEISISWMNFTSGPPITSNMISGKLDVGFMGDMPLLINGDFSQKNQYYESTLILFDGKAENGNNQDILVHNKSNIEKIEDLQGKKVSTPNSSSAHRYLISELDKAGIEKSKVFISFQDLATGIKLLEKGDVDAISVWEPYSEYLKNEGYKALPKNSNDSYLAGVVINSKIIMEEKEIYEALVCAIEKSHKILQSPSKEVLEMLSKEWKVPQTLDTFSMCY